jgi:hypothetical protein
VARLVRMPVGYFMSLWQKKYHSFSPIFALPVVIYRSTCMGKTSNKLKHVLCGGAIEEQKGIS